MLFRLARPALFALDPERAHVLTIKALKAMPARPPAAPGPLAVEIAGIRFPNPVGIAAGFDKDGEVPDQLLGLGFGFAEVGSITPRPQAGNPKPRLFRLVEDGAVINRMGFNNGGGEAAARRLEARAHRPGVLGINIGANKDSADRIADYAAMTQLMAPLATYLAVNISSPNTPGLRALQDEGALVALLDAVLAVRGSDGPPVFLKVAPDLEPADIDAICAHRDGQAAWRADRIEHDHLAARACDRIMLAKREVCPARLCANWRSSGVRDFRKATGGAMPLVGVGGIATAEHAWERIRAGASLVQFYSAMVYGGPGLPRQITRGLERLMKRDGFSTIAEAVGTE